MDICEAAGIACQSLLPKKSRARYEFTYDVFKKWCAKKNVQSVSENCMLAFMLERSERLKSSASLWCEYSMLKTTLNYKDNVDISKFLKLVGFLNRKHQGYQPKKSQVLTREEIQEFIENAADETHLLIKTVMIVGIAGACRIDKFCKMEMADVGDHGKYFTITIPQSKNDVVRKFTIVENLESKIDYLKIFKKYYEIRKQVVNNSRLFLRYQFGRCFNQPVGKHTFAKMPSVIARFLNLPEANSYTGHCFRRSSATLLVESGEDILGLKRHGGWKSSTVAVNYVAESIRNKLDVANKILYNENPMHSSSVRKPTPSTSQMVANSPKVEMPFSSEISPPTPSNTMQTTTASFENETIEVLEHAGFVIQNSTFSQCSLVFNFGKKTNQYLAV